jgi:putative ABC transport system permease protein
MGVEARVETLLQDLRYGLRSFARNPGFSAVAIFVLALGIGANTAIFSVVNGVLLRPLPYKDSGRLLSVRELSPKGNAVPVSPANFNDWRRQAKTVELAVYQSVPVNLTGAGEPARLRETRTSASLFPLLGVAPMLGRTFLPEEDEESRRFEVLLSYSFWRSRFGGDPAILGKTLDLDGNPHAVVGVMRRTFAFPERSDLWVPMAFRANEVNAHGAKYLLSVGRLNPGVTLEQARAEMDTIARRLQEQYPDSNKDWGVRMVPLLESRVSNVQTSLWVLAGAVGLVLLIACANVANLLLARGAARQKEVAIRRALGAPRARMIRQLLTESLLLSALGGALGLGVAWAGVQVLLAMAPQEIPRLGEVGLDAQTLLYATGVMLLTGIIFGLAPALHLSKVELSETLKEGGRTGGADPRGRARSVLVVSEIALALILLAGSGLLIRSFLRLQNVELGFRPENVLTMSISLPDKYKTDQQQAEFFRSVLERTSVLPGVLKASAVTFLPLDLDFVFHVQREGHQAQNEGVTSNYFAISPAYFQAMGIPLVKGRAFSEQDNAQGPRVAIINETLARRLFPNENPVGQRIYITNGPLLWSEIVGVVGDAKQYGLDRPATPQVYEPYQQHTWSWMSLAIRTSGDPLSVASAVRQQVAAVDKDQPVADVRTMEDIVALSITQQRFSLLLLSLFAGLALVLAAAGIYGVMAYSVIQRTREIRIRMALGARSSDVLRMIVGKGLALTLLGVAAGLAGALALGRFLVTLLFEVRPNDPATLAIVSALLVGVACAASYLPARRAMKVDPLVALRYE